MTWWRSMLGFVCALLKIRCNRPRLRAGTASMAPKMVRDRLEHLSCEKFKYHQGSCETRRLDPETRDEEIEVWH